MKFRKDCIIFVFICQLCRLCSFAFITNYMRTINLRIHHFFDIIRDFGRNTEFKPHPYGHSYPVLADIIWNNSGLRFIIISKCDDICIGCKHLTGNSCNDIIEHRKDFKSKEKFNEYIDNRIMKVCSIRENEMFSTIELCKKAALYLDNIFWIYEGNDYAHTQKRKKCVTNGLKMYFERHKFSLH